MMLPKNLKKWWDLNLIVNLDNDSKFCPVGVTLSGGHDDISSPEIPDQIADLECHTGTLGMPQASQPKKNPAATSATVSNISKKILILLSPKIPSGFLAS